MRTKELADALEEMTKGRLDTSALGTASILRAAASALRENEKLREIINLYIDPINVRPEHEEMVRALTGETE